MTARFEPRVVDPRRSAVPLVIGPQKGSGPVRPGAWSDAARALGGLAIAERRLYLALRLAMIFLLGAFIAAHFAFGLTLARGTAFAVLLAIVPPTIVGLYLHRRTALTDRWLVGLLVSDIVVLTLGNHYSGGVESSFGYAYLAVVLGSALFLERRMAVLFTVLCVIAYVTLVLLEYFRLIPHHDFLGVPLESNTSYVVYECAMKTMVFLATSLVASAVATSARKAYARLEVQERRLRQFAAEALAMQEVESRRIARELHDGAGQALTAARLHLQSAAAKVASEYAAEYAARSATDGTPPVRESLMTTVRLLDAAMDEVRRSAAALGPTTLDELGLHEALRRHCDDMAAARKVKIRLCDKPAQSGDEVRPPVAIERACYRIAQEALTNAVRHAQARSIEVRVLGDAETVGVEVRDDGIGFDPERAQRGLGISGMTDRVTLLGGTLTIDSEPGRGTRVHAVIPLRPDTDVV
jgi:signal transduction histidine kinase